MRNALILILTLCLTAQTHTLADDPARSQIRHWITQLGDDSFIVRQRAETLLRHAGIRAYSELRLAEKHYDQEIVRRAEYLLSQIEQTFLALENRETAVWIRWYMENPDLTAKASIIEALADPTLDLTKGEGLHTLCRLLRFEENASLRLHAAKTLIAHPPVSLSLRQNWFQHVRDTFSDIAFADGDDELLKTLADYASLAVSLATRTNASDAVDQDRVRQVAEQTLNLLQRPENNIPAFSGINLLLRYAVAELYDAAGLATERDKTVAAALAVPSQPIQEHELHLPIGNVDRSLYMHEHYHTGMCLLLRFRLHWARAHFEKVIESGDVLLRVAASEWAANVALYLADYALAVEFYNKHIEILDSPEYREGHDPTLQIAAARKQVLYCQAEQYFNEENWAKAQELVMQAWSVPGASIEMSDVDLVILAYRLDKRQFDIALAFRDEFDGVFRRVWRSIADFYSDLGIPERRLERMPTVANAAAWLLANTDGNFSSALILVEAALRSSPDDVSFLDTLSHVYFLGGRIEDAVLTQERVVQIAPEAVTFQRALDRFRAALKDAEPQP